MDLNLSQKPKPPEFNNSAGRLIRLLEMLPSQYSYFDTITKFYTPATSPEPEMQGRAYLDFMGLVGKSFDAFLTDIENSPNIPDLTRGLIKEGLTNLAQYAFTNSPASAPRKLQDAELALVRMAGSMLDMEPDLPESDVDSIRESIESLRKELEKADLTKSARQALLELVRLSRNALDHYNIYGAQGFRKAFKKMLSELMEVYLHEGAEVTKSSWWQTAMSHAKLVDSVAGKMLKYKPLLEGAGKLFLANSGG